MVNKDSSLFFIIFKMGSKATTRSWWVFVGSHWLNTNPLILIESDVSWNQKIPKQTFAYIEKLKKKTIEWYLQIDRFFKNYLRGVFWK